MKHIILGLLSLMIIAIEADAQGPPITTDKPIMVGSDTKIIKTLTEIRSTDGGTFVRAPLMIHYIFDRSYLMAIHLPMVYTPHGDGLGDIDILAKYQFYRNDQKGKTHRIAFKTKQTIPTGQFIGDPDFGIEKYQSYYGVVSGYETIKHSIGAEIGYRYVDGPSQNSFKAALAFGLPLLKPLYPVKQLNLYFENIANYFPSEGAWNIRMAQGIQYAIKQWTFGASIQVPLLQEFIDFHKHNYSLFIDTRYIF